MESYLPAVYILILLGLLGGASWFVLKQVFKTRKLETSLSKLQAQLQQGKGTTQEYFELGSIYLSKNISVQAIAQFQKALKAAELEGETSIAPIYNALGYAYFLQEQYDLAIRNYKEALKLNPNYVTALNNLGHAYERKNLSAQALEAYEQSLEKDDKNAIARQRATALRRRLVTSNG
jgi:tetratricopeptide (TPR) repeat protein